MRYPGYVAFAIGSFAVNLANADTLFVSGSHHIREDGPSGSRAVEERSDNSSPKQQIIWPKDGRDVETNSKTENFLKAVTQQTEIYSYMETEHKLLFWLANLTDSQIDTVRRNAGVDEVQEDTKDVLEAACPWQCAPTKLPVFDKLKRDGIQYTSQTSAASELIMISQPT